MIRSRYLQQRARAGDPVALARILVSIPSVNPDLEPGGAGEEEIARQCAEWLGEWGYEVRLGRVAEGRWNVTASRGQGDPVLLLNGHLDTVGVRGMEGNPFSGELRGGRIWGRGAADMKGGVAMLLATAAGLAREPWPGGCLRLALTADEENASLGMQVLLQEGLSAHAAVVAEPTSLAVMPAHKGFLWIEGEVRGRAAHGSRYDLGVDAIFHAARFLAALEEVQEELEARPRHPLLGRPSFHVGTIQGGTAPSVYPHSCRFVLERRTLPGEGPAEAMAAFHRVFRDLKRNTPAMAGRLRQGLFRAGTEVPLDSPLVQGLLQAVREEGMPDKVEGMTAWVEAGCLNEAKIPAVCFGPGSIALAHGAVEWVAAEELALGTRILTRFARRFLEASGPFHGGW